ncbi:MAG: hypothetical protein ABI361_12135 [Nitrososphaera sp.]|jgi:hypothetical protein
MIYASDFGLPVDGEKLRRALDDAFIEGPVLSKMLENMGISFGVPPSPMHEIHSAIKVLLGETAGSLIIENFRKQLESG